MVDAARDPVATSGDNGEAPLAEQPSRWRGPNCNWWQQALLLEVGDPLSEHVFGVHAVLEPGLANLDSADEHRRKLLETTAEAEVGVDAGLTDKLLKVRRSLKVELTNDLFPFFLMFGHLVRQGHRFVLPDLHTERVGHGGPAIAHDENVAVCDVEVLASGLLRCLHHPLHRPGEEVRVHVFRQEVSLTGEVEWLTGMMLQGCVGTDSRYRVHVAANRLPADDLGTQDRPTPPVPLLLLFAEVVLLHPVEVLVLVARLPLLTRQLHRFDMHSVSLRPLHEDEMLQVGRRSL